MAALEDAEGGRQLDFLENVFGDFWGPTGVEWRLYRLASEKVSAPS